MINKTVKKYIVLSELFGSPVKKISECKSLLYVILIIYSPYYVVYN